MKITNSSLVGGSIVLLAKCPIPGSCKTRLAPLLGEDGAALLAKAMLSDILSTLSHCSELENTLKVLMYAPGTKHGEMQMITILQSLNLMHQLVSEDSESVNTNQSTFVDVHEGWCLLPMCTSLESESNNRETSTSNLTSSSLGEKLADGLKRTRVLNSRRNNGVESYKNEAVLFLGMDAPELPIKEIIYGLQIASEGLPKIVDAKTNFDAVMPGKAHMCPADDGGYGLLSVPIHAPSSLIFSGVRWSDPLTAVSQIKALTDAAIGVSIGRMMHDVDEPEDVRKLAARLIRAEGRTVMASISNDVLTKYSSKIDSQAVAFDYSKHCLHTLQTMIELGVLVSDCNDHSSYHVNNRIFDSIRT